MTTKTSATAAAAAKIAKPKSRKVSPAKQQQVALPLPGPALPEYGQLAIEAINVRPQVREKFDEDALRDLASDIADRGILQPLTIRKIEDGFVLVAGERRLRAAKLAGLESVPVLIQTMSEDEHHMAQLAENIQREELTTAETAKAIRKLYDLGNNVQEIADMVHKSKSWVSKRLSASAPDLNSSAKALLEDGHTEDLEIIIGINSIFALDHAAGYSMCQLVREGKAGRETIREKIEALKKRRAEIEAEQPPEETEEAKQLRIAQETQRNEMTPSQSFRQWFKASQQWHDQNSINVFLSELATGADELRAQLERYTQLMDQAGKVHSAFMRAITAQVKELQPTYGDMMLHTAYCKYQREKNGNQ